MSVLFFWRGSDYRKNTSEGLAYELNQNSERLASLTPGDHIWAFTRRVDKAYVLAADLVVSRVTRNAPSDTGYQYGLYCAKADSSTSRYFQTEAAPNAEALIRSLSFRPTAGVLGSSFQGPNAVRNLTRDDVIALTKHGSEIPVLQ